MKNIINILFGDQVSRARSRVKDAAEDLARKNAEVQFHQYLKYFHQDLAAQTDPETNWWTFADHKQKAYDHQEEMAYWEDRALTSQKKLTASVERLAAIRAAKQESQID